MMELARRRILSSLLALGACDFTGAASPPPVAEDDVAVRIAPLTNFTSGLVAGSGRYFYIGSGNYVNEDGSACSGGNCVFTAPRIPGGADAPIARLRDGVPKAGGVCGFPGTVLPPPWIWPRPEADMAIVALQQRRNGTAQTRLDANGQSTAPGALFADGTYEWRIAQICTSDMPMHIGTASTWLDVKTCSTVDDANPASNDNNISTYTTNPATQLGGCQIAPLIDNIDNYSMSYNGTSMTLCYDTLAAPDPAAFKTLSLTAIGARSSKTGLTTNVPVPPMTERSGTVTTCTGATIDVSPWDGDACDGREFRRWLGACSGTGACTVTMTRDTSVTAVFAAHDCGPGHEWDPGACGCVERGNAPARAGRQP